MIGTKTEQRETKGKALSLGLLVAVFMTACVLVLAAKPAHAQFILVFTVDSTGDEPDANAGDNVCATSGGTCTLRAAIEEANANGTTGTDNIWFDIPGSGVQTISPASALPSITQPVAIDGYSQPGSRPNTATTGTNAVLNIELKGTNAGSASGLRIEGTASAPAPWDVAIRGLVINRFAGNGIVFLPGGPSFVGGIQHRVEGNFIGTDPSGTAAEPNTDDGVEFFRTDASIVGGTGPGSRNLISGNRSYGVNFNDSSYITLQGNLIGTKKDGATALGNAGNGVIVSESSYNNTLMGNTIAFNSFEGVYVGSTGNNTGNRILSNSIFANGDASPANLGIDLNGGTEDANEVTQNDPSDADVGPNNLQNYPEITSAKHVTVTKKKKKKGKKRKKRTIVVATDVAGSLNSLPGQSFTLQFFSNPAADPSGFGEGKTFLGQKSVTTDTTGNAAFSTRLAPTGGAITATATNDSTGDTSEFSAAKAVG